MGAHSSLGPIDPQIAGIPAHGVVEEFNEAAQQIRADQANIPLWQPIIAKYHPTLVGEWQKAIMWSNEVVKEWLVTGMFDSYADADARADRVVRDLGDHALTRSHSRHIAIDRVRDLGVSVSALEDDQDLQEAVLTVHHACLHTLGGTPTIKLIENQNGQAFIQQIQLVAQQVPIPNQ